MTVTDTGHRAPPYDPDAEEAVCGLALDNSWTAPLPDIDPDDLYVPDHRRLYIIARDLRNQGRTIRPKDIPDDLRPLARRAIKAWVAPDREAAAVRDAARARRAISAAHDIRTAAYASDLDAVAAIAAQLTDEAP